MRTRYRFQILSLLVLAWLLLLGTSGSVIADTTQPVTVTPSNTQTFFSTKERPTLIAAQMARGVMSR